MFLLSLYLKSKKVEVELISNDVELNIICNIESEKYKSDRVKEEIIESLTYPLKCVQSDYLTVKNIIFYPKRK